MIEVKINGLFMTQTQNSGVILKEVDGDRTLPIIIGEYEAQSIALGMENIAPPRPITHDLLLSMLDTVEASMERVLITELKNNTYFATILIRFGDKVLEIDSRPSDAIALAVRQNIQIFVAAEVMRKGAYSADEMQDLDQKQIDSTQERLDQLKRDLQDAVDKEEYERAAKIRDEIDRLEPRQ